MSDRSTNGTAPSPSEPVTPAPPVLITYPTVRPEIVIVPIVSSIVLFPAAVLVIICCLKRRAERARRRGKRQRYNSLRSRDNMHRRPVPIIRIHGARRNFPGVKARDRDGSCLRLGELHYSTATVFQAVLGIDLDLDERSDWESDVMGYTSLRPVSPSSSSTNSLQVCRRSSGPQIIQMEMSPRVKRSNRAFCQPSPARPGGDICRQLSDNSAAISRRPSENGSQSTAKVQPGELAAAVLRSPEQEDAAILRRPEAENDSILCSPKHGATTFLRLPENHGASCLRPAEYNGAVLYRPKEQGGTAILRQLEQDRHVVSRRLEQDGSAARASAERNSPAAWRPPDKLFDPAAVSNGVHPAGGETDDVGTSDTSGTDCAEPACGAVDAMCRTDDSGTLC